jgi:hypothetical protein
MRNSVAEISQQPLRCQFWATLEGLKCLQIEESLQTDLAGMHKKYPELRACLINSSLGEMFFSTVTSIPEEVREAGLCDAIVFEDKKYWLRCFLREALKDTLIRKSGLLDTHADLYITGSGSLSQLCASVGVGLGFRRINWVAGDEKLATASIQKFQKLFFDIEINFINDNELTLQPSNGSLLINTVDEQEGTSLLEDLTFLNFMKEASVVVSLPLLQKQSKLLHEAAELGIKGIDGIDVWGLRDYFFLRSALGSGFSISESDYLEKWSHFIKNQDHGPVTKETTES